MTRKRYDVLVKPLEEALSSSGILYTTPETDKQLEDFRLPELGLKLYVCRTPREAAFVIPPGEQDAIAVIGKGGVSGLAKLLGMRIEEDEFGGVL